MNIQDRINAFQAKEIDWQQTGRNLASVAYNLAVAVGVVCYLTFIVTRGCFRLGRRAADLWVQYQMSDRIVAMYGRVVAHVKALPGLSVRVAEVRSAYGQFGQQVQGVVSAVQKDYEEIKA